MQYVVETGALYFLQLAADGYASLERLDVHFPGNRRITLVRNIAKPADFIVDQSNRYNCL